MKKIPITVEFNNKTVIGYVELTEDGKKLYEKRIVAAGPGSKHVPVLSPAYISDFPDENGAITKAELIELSLIPAYSLIPKEEK